MEKEETVLKMKIVLCVNAVLDRADRMIWLLLLGGPSLGVGLGELAQYHWLLGWVLASAGTLIIIIRPAGTSARNHYRLSRARQLIREAAQHEDPSALAEASWVLDQVAQSLGVDSDAGA